MTDPAESGPGRFEPFWRSLSTLPTALPLAVSGYGLVAMVLLLAGQFRAALVLPLGGLAALAAVAAGGFGPRVPGRERRACDLLVLLLAAGAAVVDIHYGNQDIQVQRDPGIYATTGAYLLHHSSLVIQTHPEIFGSRDALTWVANGYGAVNAHGQIFAQNMHLVPVLIATLGFAVGAYHALWATAILGGCALLAVYAVGRQLARPAYALLVTALLAGILPELYVSRDTYTEPVDQLLIFGALALLWLAQRSGRRRDAVLAGLVLGASTMTRIDGYLNLDAVLVAALVLLALAPVGQRRLTASRCLLVAAAAAPATVVSYLDVTRLSSGYYTSQRAGILALLELLAALAVLGVVAVALCWRLALPDRLERLSRRWRAPAAVVVVVGAALLLASRPLWLVGRDSATNVADPLVAALQRARGVAVDPTRSYAEQSVNWLAWYVGPAALVIGLVGLCLLTWWLMRGRRRLALPFVAVFTATTLLYLVAPHIVPDQAWASRRFVPVTFPGVVVCVAVALDRLPRSALGYGAAAVAALALFIPPALISAPLFRHAQYLGEASAAKALCRALPADAAVVYTDAFGHQDMPTERGFCGHPAETLPSATPAVLAATRATAAAHGYRLYGVSTVAGSPLQSHSRPPTLVSSIDYPTWALTLLAPPRTITLQPLQVWVGPVTAAGLIG